MRNVIFLAALAVVAVGCAPTPVEVCKSGIDTTCSRLFECQSDAVKNSNEFKTIYGTSVAECKTKLETAVNCAARTNYDQGCTGTNAGKTYDLFKASECSNAVKALSCTDFLDPAKIPAVCGQICK